MNLMAAVREWGRFVQFSQTAWALPFGLAAMVVAARDQAGWPGLRVFGLVLIAMVSARTCAVAFNQIVDREHDRLNPRTAGRSLPAGRVTAVEAWGVCAAGAIGLVAASYFLNRICFFLSPVALLVICSYSLAKRWTDYTHLVLGVAMAMAPLGAWLAVRGTLGISVVVLALAVVFWHVGFDIMDSLQDYEFDRRHGLRSLVVAWGPRNALRAAFLAHMLMWGGLAAFGLISRFRVAYVAGMIVMLATLLLEHWLAWRRRIQWAHGAFSRLHALISAVFLIVTVAEVVFPWFRVSR
ncbi:MAG TPA: UbiA-like polyprenyltransferase [Candidatus Paceibacterota bacterium]|nr:UbiA-like polyprenyltransferase [Verrucomicrobiota bacterium]HRZ46381.1 UbiA-like polyprenyltransferase [Candidatus Paceibacterota bacterium]HRZ92516.1 UbiA-like polyprenyltransferase [Candidatus Paceibacterota bacterium]